MKTTILSSIMLILAFFGSTNLQAQEKNTSKNNYVVMTKKVPQLQPIILAAEALKAEEGKNFGEFQVIICGKLIGDITDPEKTNKLIKKAKKADVTLIACGFSLTKFNVDRATVPKAFKIVENGILHNLQLQKKEYKSLSL